MFSSSRPAWKRLPMCDHQEDICGWNLYMSINFYMMANYSHVHVWYIFWLFKEIRLRNDYCECIIVLSVWKWFGGKHVGNMGLDAIIVGSGNRLVWWRLVVLVRVSLYLCHVFICRCWRNNMCSWNCWPSGLKVFIVSILCYKSFGRFGFYWFL